MLKPLSINIPFPDICDESCIFCDFKKNKQSLQTNLTNTMIERIDIAHQLGFNDISFCSGEFLLLPPQTIEQITSFFYNKKMNANFTTNGKYLTHFSPDLLNKYDRFFVSLLTSKEELYNQLHPNLSFDLVMDNVRQLRRNRLMNKTKIHANVMICAITVDDLLDSYLTFRDMGYIVSFNLIQQKFTEEIITDDIKFLFDVDLFKLENVLDKILSYVNDPFVMDQRYANDIIDYFRMIKESNYKTSRFHLEKPSCYGNVVQIYQNEKVIVYECATKRITSEDMGSFYEKVRNCHLSCAINGCNRFDIQVNEE